jgi:hypothetical protein
MKYFSKKQKIQRRIKTLEDIELEGEEAKERID